MAVKAVVDCIRGVIASASLKRKPADENESGFFGIRGVIASASLKQDLNLFHGNYTPEVSEALLPRPH